MIGFPMGLLEIFFICLPWIVLFYKRAGPECVLFSSTVLFSLNMLVCLLKKVQLSYICFFSLWVYDVTAVDSLLLSYLWFICGW